MRKRRGKREKEKDKGERKENEEGPSGRMNTRVGDKAEEGKLANPDKSGMNPVCRSGCRLTKLTNLGARHQLERGFRSSDSSICG
jgi:hypothetical protein